MDMNSTHCLNMQGMGWMMGSMGMIGILFSVALILAIAALIKYLFRKKKPSLS